MTHKLTVHIDYASDLWDDAFDNLDDILEQVAQETFSRAKKPDAFKNKMFDVNVTLTDNTHIQTLNADYRGMDKPTNVLSFPQFDMNTFTAESLRAFPPEIDVPLGDVVIAFETIKREADEQQKKLQDHTVHMFVHGTLHLLGYDHINDADAEIMEKLECDILLHFGYPDPYHEERD